MRSNREGGNFIGGNSVTEKQIFSAFVRASGVLVVLDGLKQFWYVLARLVWTDGHYLYSFSQDLTYTLIILAVGAIIIRQPDWFVRFAWPPESEISN
jgi:hypothetical protein